MAKQVLHMDYSTSRSLLIFLTYLANNGKLNEDMYFYIFGKEQLSEEEKARMLAHHYRGFYSMLSMLTLYDEIVVYPVEGEYYGAAEPPVRCGESHLSGLTEPPYLF